MINHFARDLRPTKYLRKETSLFEGKPLAQSVECRAVDRKGAGSNLITRGAALCS